MEEIRVDKIMKDPKYWEDRRKAVEDRLDFLLMVRSDYIKSKDSLPIGSKSWYVYDKLIQEQTEKIDVARNEWKEIRKT